MKMTGEKGLMAEDVDSGFRYRDTHLDTISVFTNVGANKAGRTAVC
jgi:hypothetical protein